MNWIAENWTNIVFTMSCVSFGASLIAKLTPNEVTNRFAFITLKIVDFLATTTGPTKLKRLKP